MKQHSPQFLKITSEASERVNHCSIEDVKQKLDNQNDFALIDVREESEFANGHLPHAIHLSKGIIERDIEKRIPDFDTSLVLYCGGGYRSAMAADNLQKMGYKNVSSMDGGWSAWRQAQFPTTDH